MVELERFHRYRHIQDAYRILENLNEFGIELKDTEGLFTEKIPEWYLRQRFSDVYGRALGDRFIRALSEKIKIPKLILDILNHHKGKSWHEIMAHVLQELWDEHARIQPRLLKGDSSATKRAKEIIAAVSWFLGEIEDISSALPKKEFDKHMTRIGIVYQGEDIPLHEAMGLSKRIRWME